PRSPEPELGRGIAGPAGRRDEMRDVRRAGMTMLALVLLAGCGGSGDGEAAPKTSEPTDPATPALAEGEPAADALKDFVCRADDKGVWSATGSVKNSGKVAVGY